QIISGSLFQKHLLEVKKCKAPIAKLFGFKSSSLKNSYRVYYCKRQFLFDTMALESCDIGLIGLAVMGQNLILNMNDHGFKVGVFNRTVSKVDRFLANEAKGTQVVGAHSLEEFVKLLKKPRAVMLLVQAGKPVDDFIDSLIPLLDKGDIIIDGGNSEFDDSTRRFERCQAAGLLFVGSGVSGGEEGARHGPSLMPGGHPDAWPRIRPIFQAVCAKVDGQPCCDWVGEGGAGHFVKMVHNGIEYGDMQLICEAYHLMKEVCGLSNDEMADVFTRWNNGDLNSFLIEITADILRHRDDDGKHTVDKILDCAGQKGTGKWTVVTSLHAGTPLTLIAEAVFARHLSRYKAERQRAAATLPGPSAAPPRPADPAAFIEDIHQALYASKIVSYAQGYMLMQTQSAQTGWKLNLGGIALMWRGGCIIRSQFLGRIKTAFERNPELDSLLLDPFFSGVMRQANDGWRRCLAAAVTAGVPCPAFSAALSFYDGFRCGRLPASLLQAQRDYFGAHQYELMDQPGKFVHTNWTGRGGQVASSTYQA
ncbi:hypothetical protein BOX15_Mlig032727g2, partial [Macrostomum lignano]